jgi:hypothetical protein
MSQKSIEPGIEEELDLICQAFKEYQETNKKNADSFWESLSYEDKCNAFHAVVERIVKGDIQDKGSYRYVLYDVFGFEKDMYTRGMDCGYMTLHNAIIEMDDQDGNISEKS